jgi:hypothetical protein
MVTEPIKNAESVKPGHENGPDHPKTSGPVRAKRDKRRHQPFLEDHFDRPTHAVAQLGLKILAELKN